MTRGARIGVLLGVTAAAVTAACVVPPHPAGSRLSPLRRHASASGASPNGWAVLSNLPFLLVGLLGLRQVLMAPRRRVGPVRRVRASAGRTRCSSRASRSPASARRTTTGRPTTPRLVWDRLPMTIGFMALLAAVVAERVSVTARDRAAAWRFSWRSAASVAYWYAGELARRGRPAALRPVQFAPAVADTARCCGSSPRATRAAATSWASSPSTALAKLFEVLDGRRSSRWDTC